MKLHDKVSILGTEYTIFKDVLETEQSMIKGNDGVTDFTTKQILIAPMEQDTPDNWQDIERYESRTIRHEIIHAILFESGLDHNAGWPRNEEIVDWMAIQFPKILEIFEALSVEKF